jgi:hypothetical protein
MFLLFLFLPNISNFPLSIPCAPRPSSASSLQQVGKDSALDGWNGISLFTIGPPHHPVLMAIGGLLLPILARKSFYEGIQMISLSGPAAPCITA